MLWWISKKQDRVLMLCRSTWLCVFKQQIIWNQDYKAKWNPGPGGTLESWVNWGTPTSKGVSKVSNTASIWFLSLLSPTDAVFSYLATIKRGNVLYLIQLSPTNFGFLLTLCSPGCLILVWIITGIWNIQKKKSEGSQDFGTALLRSWRFLDEWDISIAEHVTRNAWQSEVLAALLCCIMMEVNKFS